MKITKKISSFHSTNYEDYLYIFICFIIILPSLIGCGPSTADFEKVNYAPLPISDWEVSTPKAQGLDPIKVAELYYNAKRLETIYSLLIVKNKYLISEDYFNNGSVDKKALLASVTKSYTSALVGIALEQGYLSNVDQKMLDFFPELANKVSDPRKEKITLRNMMEMRAGYPWEKTHPDLYRGLFAGQNWPHLIEQFPLVSDPGTRFHYSNMTSNWIGLIIARSSGMSLKDYAEEYLFTPLDVKVGEWIQDVDGNNVGCGGLHFSARDVAKFGLLYLNDGVYNGNQIVPANWVKDSLKTYSVNEGFKKKVGHFHDIGYGYHWWSANVGKHHVNFAWGHGGQLIVLVDHFDLVIVTTAYPPRKEYSRNSWRNEKAIFKVVSKFIKSLPSE